MSDRYQQFVGSPPGKLLVKQLGLPNPAQLRRYEPGQPLLEGPALLGAAGGGRLARPAADLLKLTRSELFVDTAATGKTAGVRGKLAGDESRRYGALVFDASGIDATARLHELYAFFHAHITELAPNARVVVLGTPPEDTDKPAAHIAQRGLEGFVRSVAKELRLGGVANLVYVAPGAEDNAESTLRFFLGAKSAFVSGQVARVGTGTSVPVADAAKPLAEKVALVTGASRGIGEAIAEVLARDGAHVVCLDIPAQGELLTKVANRIGGSTLQLDVTAADAPATLASHLQERHGGVDVVVHNAGVTMDRTLARMKAEKWDRLIAINLTAMERLTDGLMVTSSGGTSSRGPKAEAPCLNENARVVCLSSMNGIAGQRGQANYATSKAGVIGFVDAYAPLLADRHVTINAVAPGFIETAMTAAMPVATREAGRRMNSLQQGGQPVDVAETIAWFASPGSGGVTGNTVRVDGQHLIGA